MSLLSASTLAALRPGVERPAYDPAGVKTGVVHFGPGAFHRAHQAAYFDTLLGGDPRWGIAAVSLRSAGTVDALARQDGLYSLTMLERDTRIRIVGAHRAFVRPGQDADVRRLLADPDVRIVTTTVTEKGYCLTPEGTLDLDHSDIAHDLAQPSSPESIVGWLVAGLAARRAAQTAPFAVLCCDNMNGNGARLRAACAAFARRSDPGLAGWIENEVSFPNTMVDSITPATDEAHRARVAAALGVRDDAAVQREAFTQWVVERFDLPGGPDLASAGVEMTGDVAAHELAKLRILNGAHSSLAYIGLALGHESVAQAMQDERLAAFVERLVRQDIIPSLPPAAGIDYASYASAVLARFRNPAIRHLLSQIAWDGSQKLPYRLLGTVADARAAGRPIERLAVPVAAWMAFVRRMTRRGDRIVDPLAERLAQAGTIADNAGLAAALLDFDMFPRDIALDERWRAAVMRALDAIDGVEPYRALSD